MDKKNKIIQVLNVFETGVAQGKYHLISVYQDGPMDKNTGRNIYQITYGRSQTTEFGNLKRLIEVYMEMDGKFSNSFQNYVNRIGQRPSLRKNKEFIKLLKRAALEDVVMKNAQDVFFDRYYYKPAHAWFTGHGFTLPLSLLVIYDSFIHSGRILGKLRQKFAEVPPVEGGDEKKWITNYVNARHDWLLSFQYHSNPKRRVLAKTVYRTQCFKDLIAANNWELEGTINANGVLIP